MLDDVVVIMHCYTNKPVSAGNAYNHVTFSALYKGTEEDNTIIGKRAPFCMCQLALIDHDVHGFFKEGKKYKVTFTEI